MLCYIFLIAQVINSSFRKSDMTQQSKYARWNAGHAQLWCVQCSHLVPGGVCCNHTSGIPPSGQDGITETGDTLSLETTKSWIKHTKQQLRDTLHQAAKRGAPERWVQVQ